MVLYWKALELCGYGHYSVLFWDGRYDLHHVRDEIVKGSDSARDSNLTKWVESFESLTDSFRFSAGICSTDLTCSIHSRVTSDTRNKPIKRNLVWSLVKLYAVSLCSFLSSVILPQQNYCYSRVIYENIKGSVVMLAENSHNNINCMKR